MNHDPIRLLGLTMEHVTNFRRQPNSKSAGLYHALDRQYEVVDVVRPAPSKLHTYLTKLRHLHPNRNVWRARASLSLGMFRQRTAIAERQLRQLHDRYDLIVQLHTLFAPGRLEARRPFVLHTDNTYLLSERYFPEWAPLRGRDRDEWIRLEQATYQQAAFLFPLSEFLRRSMIEDYGCDPERVIRVGGGSNFAPVSLANKRYDRQIALFVGSDFERKGGHTLLKAFRQVREVLPDAELWIVGPKRPLAEPQPGVVWHGYVTDRTAVANMYREATLFVMPSVFEPWGYVFHEAMANGLACVATNLCAMPEIVRDGETGLLVPVGEVEPLAAALVTLLGDPDRAQTMGGRGHAETANGHTWDDVVTRMAPFIERAVGEQAARSVGYAF